MILVAAALETLNRHGIRGRRNRRRRRRRNSRRRNRSIVIGDGTKGTKDLETGLTGAGTLETNEMVTIRASRTRRRLWWHAGCGGVEWSGGGGGGGGCRHFCCGCQCGWWYKRHHGLDRHDQGGCERLAGQHGRGGRQGTTTDMTTIHSCWCW